MSILGHMRTTTESAGIEPAEADWREEWPVRRTMLSMARRPDLSARAAGSPPGDRFRNAFDAVLIRRLRVDLDPDDSRADGNRFLSSREAAQPVSLLN